MLGTFLLGSFFAYDCTLLALKMKYSKIENEVKNNILKDGLYHFTKNEFADKILEDGYIRPSNIISSLGPKKTFFFAGIPEPELLRENIAEFYQQYEYTAIQIKPDEQDLENYRIRAYDDNSVVCNGKCKLVEGKVRKVNLVLDLNKDGIPFIREKTKEELLNGYTPSKELQQKIHPSQNALTTTKNMLIASLKKYVSPILALKKKLMPKKPKVENEFKKSSSMSTRENFLNKLKIKPTSYKIDFNENKNFILNYSEKDPVKDSIEGQVKDFERDD